MILTFVIIIAFIIDYFLGDPKYIYHPVVLIGKLISLCEKCLERIFPNSNRGRYIAGAMLTIIVSMSSFAVPFIVIYFATKISVWLGIFIELFWCWQIFAANSLKKAAIGVYEAVKKEDIAQARSRLAMIVGRDTDELDFEQIVKATVETVAENTSDGIIAPMLFMMIGGAPLSFFYKSVNTLDSMVGYRNEKYMYFGRVSAKFDDLLNFIPARITGIFMILSSPLIGLNARESFRIFKRDRKKHKSPNSANPEAACAGALEIQLGGNASYFGKTIAKDTIGDPKKTISAQDIIRSNSLMYASSIMSMVFFAIIRILFLLMLERGHI